MTSATRRVVVENDGHGKSVVTDDSQVAAIAAGAGTGISGSELWSSDMMPVDNSAAAGAEQKNGVLEKYGNRLFVGNGGGIAFRITEFPAGHARIAHRTETLDYDLILAGEIDLELDGGEAVHLKTGDTVIVRGATHAWLNRNRETAVVAFIMADAKPVVIDGKELKTQIPVKE